MPTPHTDPATAAPAAEPARGALRLHMTREPGRDTLDGGWWPHSRDLVVELTDLVEHFPERFGRITRVLVSPQDWDLRAGSVAVSGRYVKVSAAARDDDAHLALLSTSHRTLLRVLVIPPGFTTDQGEEALLAAATHANSHSAQELLDTVTEHPDVDPRDHWPED